MLTLPQQFALAGPIGLAEPHGDAADRRIHKEELTCSPQNEPTRLSNIDFQKRLKSL